VPSVQGMKRLAPLLVGIWLVPAVALAQFFESIPSSRRTWDDFHCGFKTDRDNVVRKNRGFACSVSFSDDHILLTDDHPVIDVEVSIAKSSIKRVWTASAGRHADSLVFITHEKDGRLVNNSIGTLHFSRYYWLWNTLNFWLAGSLEATPPTESPQPE